MATPARAHLDDLLRARKLDARVWSASAAPPTAAPRVAPSGLDTLEARLGGGWPRGQVSEVVGARTSGRTRIAMTSLAAATRRGEMAALVDTLDMFDPDSASAIDPDWRLWLWVRGRGLGTTRHRPGAVRARDDQGLVAQAVDRALKATAMLLTAGGFGLVVIDVADVPAPVLRQVPFTTWMRLQRFVEGGETACLVMAPEPLTRGPGGVSLRLTATSGSAGAWQGGSNWARRFMGPGTRVTMARARAAAGDAEPQDLDGQSAGSEASLPGAARCAMGAMPACVPRNGAS